MEAERTRFGTALLFGGAGFIGTHLAEFLLSQRLVDRVVSADIRAPRRPVAGVTYIDVDVRREVPESVTDEAPGLICNLAAVHREPGHESHEYFETNIRGAENVCNYAEAVGSSTIVFTSSISVYGPTEEPKDERALPEPQTPYGASKLVAEHIHQRWAATAHTRRLLIVRPGVVFGPGEGGNVSRLVRAVSTGYFAYCGNHHVRKAGGYVTELCNSIVWFLQRMQRDDLKTLTYNFSMNPTPRLDEFVAAVAEVAGRRTPSLALPYRPMLAVSHIVSAAASLVRVQQPVHPVRVKKLRRSNYIVARAMETHGYHPLFSLKTALEDWRARMPSEWRRR